ncbi:MULTISPECIES: Ig-like domain-containing protein [unclassified Streptomyces]|uniref:Ig-like domain-containing protein n=1 Tax=unclassified Streptomyces TaxID=2593676 RepID=UPI00382DFD0B
MEEEDLTAPRQPKLGKPSTGAGAGGGRVGLTVTAEQGSRIEITETDADYDTRVVATATATGGSQVITFKAADGSHTYSVTATDAAGNESDESDGITVEVDSQAPEIGLFSLGTPDPATAVTPVTVESEADAAYTLTIDGRKERFSGVVDGGGSVDGLGFSLPNGSYTARLAVTDDAGNVRRTTRAFKVDLSKLTPVLVTTGKPGSARPTYTLTVPPLSRGTLVVGDAVRETFTADKNGRAQVGLQMADGVYPAPVVEVTDPYGRTGRATGTRTIVDTTAPTLTITTSAERATHGTLALAVTTEHGAEVAVTYGTTAEQRFPQYTARAGATTLDRELAPGDYVVTVVATDAYGNAVSKKIRVTVDDRWTTGQWIGLLVILLLALALATAVVVFLNRSRPAREERRARRAAEREQRERAERERQEAAAHERQLRAYESALTAWERQRRHLVALAEFAAEFDEAEWGAGRWPEAWGKRRRGEVVRWSTAGELVQRNAQGAITGAVKTGSVVVTSQRVLFVGDSKREWLFSQLTWIDLAGDSTTWMRVSTRTTVSGVRTSQEREKTRLAIELAVAAAPAGAAGRAPELGAGVGPVLVRLRTALTAHDRQQPRKPQAPDRVGSEQAAMPRV